MCHQKVNVPKICILLVEDHDEVAMYHQKQTSLNKPSIKLNLFKIVSPKVFKLDHLVMNKKARNSAIFVPPFSLMILVQSYMLFKNLVETWV